MKMFYLTYFLFYGAVIFSSCGMISSSESAFSTYFRAKADTQ